MEITLLEDPACSWCWAFQPVITTLEFEILDGAQKRPIRMRSVLGGLSDRPIMEGSFFIRQWTQAAEISGMPFETGIWDRHLLRTSFEACRAAKAALGQGGGAVRRLLRRIREAYFTEQVPIDSRENLIELARTEGLDTEAMTEALASGRAGFLFERDRLEAAPYRFGFPTMLLRKHPNDTPVALHGMVPYADILQLLLQMGLDPNDRRKFCDRPEDWDRLFSLHRRLAPAEVQMVTGLEGDALVEICARNGVEQEGAFLMRRTASSTPRAESTTASIAKTIDGAIDDPLVDGLAEAEVGTEVGIAVEVEACPQSCTEAMEDTAASGLNTEPAEDEIPDSLPAAEALRQAAETADS